MTDQPTARFSILPIAVTTLLAAAAVGVFVSGIGNAISWLFVALAVSAAAAALVGHRGVPEGDASELDAAGSVRRDWRGTGVLLAIPSTVALAWLVLQREPLTSDLRDGALITVLFSAFVIGTVLRVHRLPLLSFPGLFLGVTFLFTCSPLILFEIEGRDAFRYWKLVDFESVLTAMPVVMLAFSSFLVGALFVRPAKGESDTAAGRFFRHDVRSLRQVGLLLYAFSILVITAFTLRGSALTLAFEGGYGDFSGARKRGELSQIVVGSLAWFLPWSLLILAATSRDRRAFNRTLALSVPAIGIMLLAGDRGSALTVMLLLAAATHLLGFRMDWKRSLAVLGLVTVLFTTVETLRKTPVSEWSPALVSASATNQVEDSRTYELGFLEGVFTGAAQSYQTLMGTVMEVPESESYRYGRDYASSIFTAVPFTNPPATFLGLDLRGENPSDWMKSILNPYGWAGQGYLQVAEAYLEFGVVGVIGLYVLLGWALTWLWRRFLMRPLDPYGLAFTLIVMDQLLILVRNDSVGVFRTLVWGALIVYVAPRLLERRATSASLAGGTNRPWRQRPPRIRWEP